MKNPSHARIFFASDFYTKIGKSSPFFLKFGNLLPINLLQAAKNFP